MSHKILRVCVIIASIFLMCLFAQIANTPDDFVRFIREWKGVAILSTLVLMTHTAQELTVAIEDYVTRAKTRQMLIRGLWGVGAVSELIITIGIGGL